MSLYFRAREALTTKLLDCGYSRKYIEFLHTHTNFCMPHWSPTIRPIKRCVPETSWLVLPFHPLLVHIGAKQAVSRFLKGSWNRDLLMEAFSTVDVPDVKVAWKLGSVPFGASLVDW